MEPKILKKRLFARRSPMPWGEASTIFYGHPINAFDEPAPMFATMVKIPKSILIISKYYKYITHGGVLFSKMPP
jgi:hypothetical protein